MYLFSVVWLLWPGAAVAKKKCNPGPYSTMVIAKKSEQKHFDRDGDGCLNRYENSLYTTFLRFGYPLVKKKKQIPYDFNNDFMLQPFEQQMYLKDKENGTLKKYVKEDHEQKIVYRAGGVRY